MPEPQSWHFAPFRLDLRDERLWCETEAVRLTAKAFGVLRCLVAQAGQLVTKDDLFAAVWGTAYVSEAALAVCIRELRRALGDTVQTPQYVETVRGRGYRFVASVTAPVAPAPPGADQWSAEVAGLPVLLVEREAALAQLHQGWAQALQGTRQIVMVTGEAGIGKTTLVDAFVAQIAATEPVWIGRGQCIEQHGAGEAYLPLLEALGRLGRGPDGARLVAVLQQQAPSWLVHLPALVSPEAFEALQQRADGTTRERMLRELAEAVEVLTAERPLVLVLEDLHWSDGATLDWLASVARRRDRASLLVLVTYRPTDAMVRAHSVHTVTQELQLQGHGIELVLGYVSAAGVATYLARRLGAQGLPEGLAQVLYQRTQGNPLFLVTMVDDLIRQGVLQEGATGWALVGEVRALARELPESLRQLIEQQVEQLPLEDQGLLAVASVAGMECTAAAMAASTEQAVEDVEARCDALARRGQFLQARGTTEWPDGTVTTQYGFRHALYQEVVYDRVPVSRRVRLHRQIGARLEAGYGAQAREVATELAAHFVRGRDVPRAVQYLHAAGENALQRSAYPEAITHLTQGLAFLEQLPDTPQRARQELHMQMALGSALMSTQECGHPEVEQAYARALTLCQQVGGPPALSPAAASCDACWPCACQQSEDTPALFPVLSGLWRYANGRAQHQQARALGERLLVVAQQSGDAGFLLQAHHALWTTAYHTGTFLTAYHHAEQGMALYTPAQHQAQTAHAGGHDPGVCGRSCAAKSLWHLGYPDQAEQWNAAAVTLAQELGHPFTLGQALLDAAGLHQWQRDVHRTYERATAALRLGTVQGAHDLVAISLVKLGWAMAMQGQVDAGLMRIQQGLALWQTMSASHIQAEMLALVAEAYGQAGRYAEGLAAVDEALVIVDTTGGRLPEAMLYGLKGAYLWRAGNRFGEAEACFEHMRTIARCQQAKSWELRATMSLARLWQQQGKRTEAYALLAPLYHWFTEGFDSVDLQGAKALLEALSA